jgi:hypothetical protein
MTSSIAEGYDYHIVSTDLGRERPYLVARHTANAEDATRALNLAGDILATVEAPEAAAR